MEKQTKDKTKFNGDGDETQESPALGADMDSARRAEFSASELQDVRERIKRSIRCAVRFHEEGGELSVIRKMSEIESKRRAHSISKQLQYEAPLAATLCACPTETRSAAPKQWDTPTNQLPGTGSNTFGHLQR